MKAIWPIFGSPALPMIRPICPNLQSHRRGCSGGRHPFRGSGPLCPQQHLHGDLPKNPCVSKPYEIWNRAPITPRTHFVLVDIPWPTRPIPPRARNSKSGKTFRCLMISRAISISATQAWTLDGFRQSGRAPISSANQSVDLDYTITGIMRYPENVTKASYNTSAFLVDDTTFKDGGLQPSFGELQRYGPPADLPSSANASAFHWGDGSVNRVHRTFVEAQSVSDRLKDKGKTSSAVKEQDLRLFHRQGQSFLAQ
jgi:hypothetical protein